jgi:pimeloyl-ACP methyl ester carboxylesterase
MLRQPRRRLRRVFLIVLVLALGLPAAGAFYQHVSVRRESARFPPPGRMVDVAGRRLHLICIGDGEPTVIFESSGFGSALSSRAAREKVATHTRVCSYDRMGMGWSDPGPAVISTGALVLDLERLLERAQLRPPYVLVPASIGGLTAELFARRHPEQVAGLVFVDAAHSGVLERLESRLTPTRIRAACLAGVAARLGLLRLADPLRLRREATEASARTIAGLYRVEPMDTFCGMLRGHTASAQEFSAAPALRRDVPLIVLTAESKAKMLPELLAPALDAEVDEMRREVSDLPQRLAQRSSRGTWRVVAGSDHLIGNSQPHAVATAILEVLGAEIRR